MRRIPALLLALLVVLPASVRAVVAAGVAILMPGAGGIVPGDFLVRNQRNFNRAGIRTIVTTSPASAAASVAAEAAAGHKSVIVGVSRGAGDTAAALAAGARPAGVVLVSGAFYRVIGLTSPDQWPPTLVVHHAADICKFTLPGAASEFVAWTRGRARLHWINTTGEPSSDPCNAQGAHGFYRKDGPAVAAIVAFIKAR